MIVFETEEEFKAAVVNILQGMRIEVSDYYDWSSENKGIEVSLYLDGDQITSDSIFI